MFTAAPQVLGLSTPLQIREALGPTPSHTATRAGRCYWIQEPQWCEAYVVTDISHECYSSLQLEFLRQPIQFSEGELG